MCRLRSVGVTFDALERMFARDKLKSESCQKNPSAPQYFTTRKLQFVRLVLLFLRPYKTECPFPNRCALGTHASSYIRSVAGTTVGRVSAVDRDEGENAEVSYSITSHWGRDKFSLHPHTGVLTLIGTLDFEQVSEEGATV